VITSGLTKGSNHNRELELLRMVFVILAAVVSVLPILLALRMVCHVYCSDPAKNESVLTSKINATRNIRKKHNCDETECAHTQRGVNAAGGAFSNILLIDSEMLLH
jgi:hypothetical protein